jgi:hypothetical protein
MFVPRQVVSNAGSLELESDEGVKDIENVYMQPAREQELL